MRVCTQAEPAPNSSYQYMGSHSANCQVTDKGARQLAKLEKLTELRIGKGRCKVVGSDDVISKEVFEVLLRMRELTVLDMQLPKVREMNLSNMNTMQAVRDWDREEQNTCQRT